MVLNIRTFTGVAFSLREPHPSQRLKTIRPPRYDLRPRLVAWHRDAGGGHWQRTYRAGRVLINLRRAAATGLARAYQII